MGSALSATSTAACADTAGASVDVTAGMTAPFCTLKNRLPTPSARLQSSVMNQPIVCAPLVSWVESKKKCPPAVALFENPGNAPVMSVRASPYATGCSGPESIDTCTPVEGMRQVALPFTIGVRPQPKFTTVPVTVPPMAGVSIEPNGRSACAL